MVLTYYCPFIAEGCLSGIARWKRHRRQGMWKGLQAFHTLSGSAIYPALTWELSEALLARVFMECHYIGMTD